MTERKVTKLHICEAHAPWFAGETRARCVEVFAEGGPGSGPTCDPDDPCRIWPGRDLFVASVCAGEADWPAHWAVNADPDADSPEEIEATRREMEAKLA